MSINTHTDILLAGAAAAFTVDLLVYPLDTIKTRLQSPDYRRLYVDAATKTLNKRVFFRGLYQGVGSIILITLPSSGVFFTTYEATRSFLGRISSNVTADGGDGGRWLPQPVINALASSVGEVVSCSVLTPAEVLKQNAQMESTDGARQGAGPSKEAAIGRKSMLDAGSSLRVLRRFDRPSQLWRGYGALVARNLPFTALQFPVFEHIKTVLFARRDASQPASRRGARRPAIETASITAVSAGIAGSMAAVVTTPIDVIKTRIMLAAGASARAGTASGSSTSSSTGTSSNNSWTVGRDIVRREGVKMLWRGGALRAVWTALGSGLYLGAYETGRAYLEDRRRGDRLSS